MFILKAFSFCKYTWTKKQENQTSRYNNGGIFHTPNEWASSFPRHIFVADFLQRLHPTIFSVTNLWPFFKQIETDKKIQLSTKMLLSSPQNAHFGYCWVFNWPSNPKPGANFDLSVVFLPSQRNAWLTTGSGENRCHARFKSLCSNPHISPQSSRAQSRISRKSDIRFPHQSGL